MVEANRMRLGKFEFVIDFGSFRRITECWSGPGWDFNFSGKCVNGDFVTLDGRIGLYCEAAPLPFAKAADYTAIEIDLPGYYDEDTGGHSSRLMSVRALKFPTCACGSLNAMEVGTALKCLA